MNPKTSNPLHRALRTTRMLLSIKRFAPTISAADNNSAEPAFRIVRAYSRQPVTPWSCGREGRRTSVVANVLKGARPVNDRARYGRSGDDPSCHEGERHPDTHTHVFDRPHVREWLDYNGKDTASGDTTYAMRPTAGQYRRREDKRNRRRNL